jgi:hypothetical protein
MSTSKQVELGSECYNLGWADCEKRVVEPLREALQALYNACPTGFGNDRALDEALKQAEAVLGVRRGA